MLLYVVSHARTPRISIPTDSAEEFQSLTRYSGAKSSAQGTLFERVLLQKIQNRPVHHNCDQLPQIPQPDSLRLCKLDCFTNAEDNETVSETVVAFGKLVSKRRPFHFSHSEARRLRAWQTEVSCTCQQEWLESLLSQNHKCLDNPISPTTDSPRPCRTPLGTILFEPKVCV